MARGQQKIQAQQKNAAKLAKLNKKKKGGKDDKKGKSESTILQARAAQSLSSSTKVTSKS